MRNKSRKNSANKNNMINKFRKKMLILFFGIIGISAAITLGSYYGLSWYYQAAKVEPGSLLHIVRALVGFVGDFYVFIIVFTVLFLVFFWIITRKYAKPLDDVSRGISSIAKGNFDVTIDIKSDDEIGFLAGSVNEAAKKLKKAVATGAFAEKSKDRLIVAVAHDLRTPLTSIMGYLELIVHNNGLSPDTVRHYAEIAYNKSKRLDTLIDGLFELTKFHYGKIELDRKMIDLSCLIEQINEEFMPILNDNDVQARLTIAKRPAYVEADGVLIARALENLINNAIKYGKEGKYIDIRLFSSENNMNAIVQVINYGSYIPEEELAFIFESFYRMEKSRSDSTGGTGLGLAIVKSIMEAHGGTVCVESTVERTVFEIELQMMSNIL